MSSKQQYKEYTIRLKKQVRELNEKISKIEAQNKEQHLPEILKSNNLKLNKFTLGLIAGMIIGVILLYLGQCIGSIIN